MSMLIPVEISRARPALEAGSAELSERAPQPRLREHGALVGHRDFQFQLGQEINNTTQTNHYTGTDQNQQTN